MAKLTTEEFANLFLFEMQILANKIKTIRGELNKFSKRNLENLEATLKQTKDDYSITFFYDPDNFEENMRNPIFRNDDKEKVAADLKAGAVRHEAEIKRGKEEIAKLEAEIKLVRERLSASDYDDFVKQKGKELEKLEQDLENLSLIASLPVYARIKSASDDEISSLRIRLVKDQEDLISNLTPKLEELEKVLTSLGDQEDNLLKAFTSDKIDVTATSVIREKRAEVESQFTSISEQIDLALLEKERLETISVDDLRNEFAEKAQKAFYETKYWDERIEKSGEYYVNDKKDYFTKRLESEWPLEKAALLELYQRVLTSGIDPRNALFASIAHDDERIERILPLADEYRKLMTEKAVVSIAKFKESDLDNAFYSVFRTSDEFRISEPTGHFWKWFGIDESSSADEVMEAIKAKISELKEIEAKLEQEYPQLVNDPFVDGPYKTDPVPIGYVKYYRTVGIGPDFLLTLEEMKSYISPSEYEDFVVKYKKLTNLKNRLFKGSITQIEISETEADLVTSFSKAINKYYEEKKKARIEARVGEYARNNISGLAPGRALTGDSFGYSNTSTAPFPTAVELSAESFEELLEELKERAIIIKQKSKVASDEIDESFDKLFAEINRVYGAEIKTDKDKLFPASKGDRYTKHDVELAERNYYQEQRITEMLKKLQSQLEIEPSVDGPVL